MRSIAFTATAILIASASAQTYEDMEFVDIAIEDGTLRGQSIGANVYFRGVPFGQPPVGELRWRAPQPVEPWAGVRYAVSPGAPCPQPVHLDGTTPNFGGVTGTTSEDCLYLNVTAPADAKNAPVVVWFYGGGFFFGAGHLGSYDGTANAAQGVITVTTNYRLGSLGNFAHPALTADAPEDEVIGGYTVADAVATLEWVKENIEAFGGDADNVTIAGQSAGGVLVSTLLATESAEGLFDKAVIQSGAFVRGGRPLEMAENQGAAAAKALGLGDDVTAETLRQIPAETLVADPATQRGFYGILDGRLVKASLKDHLEAGTEIDVPVIAGSNAGEGGFRAAQELVSMAGDSGKAAWLYQFAYTPSHQTEAWANGPIHSAELMFTFDSMATSGWAADEPSDLDEQVADHMNACWVAFYKMKPNAKRLRCDGFTWPAYGEDTKAVAQFAAEPSVIDASTLPDGPSAD